jgi:HlyD family secretion protein
LVLTGGAWWWMARNGAAPGYQTAVVSRGDLTQVVSATGQLNPVVSVQVGSQVSGIIQHLYADFNARVRKGQVIAQLDPSTYQANLRQAEGDLSSTRAALELARIKAARAAELRAKALIPEADDDQAQADLHQAQAAVAIKDATVQKARVDIERCTIVAPIDGVVISRSVDVGQTVAASLSAPTLFVIANDLTKMQINAAVSEADIGGVEGGQDVDFTVDAFPSRKFHGRVVQVRNAPVTVQNVVTYDTIIAVDNADLKLKPGMTANVSIVIARRVDVLTVPNAALRFRPAETTERVRSSGRAPAAAPQGRPGGSVQPSGATEAQRTTGERSGGRTVYTMPEGQERGSPARVTVVTGISDGVATEIVDGLREGDRVITGLRVADADPNRPANNPFSGRRPF